MKIFNWSMVALMVASGVVMYITPDRQLFEDDPIEGKLAAAVFLFSYTKGCHMCHRVSVKLYRTDNRNTNL